jgi:methylthioribose-1-phosphate isomerase
VTIEYRDPDEVLLVGGWRMAPDESGALNPAFDVTPADLVTAIVTEARVIEPARPTVSTGVAHAVPMGVAHAVTVPAMRMVGAS